MILVYVKGMSGPVPEKWPVLLRDMNGKPKPYLAMHTLTPEQAKLSFDELMVMFPPPKVDAMSNLTTTAEIVADHMDEILKLFKSGKKITVLVRTPDDPEGRFDFMMGDDDPQELLNMIARRKAAGAT